MGVQITLRVTDEMFSTLSEVQKQYMHPNVTETVRMVLGDWLYKWRENRAEKLGNELGVPND